MTTFKAACAETSCI